MKRVKATSESTIIGVDPGLRATGLAVLDISDPKRLEVIDAGEITPKARLPLEARLGILFDETEQVLKRWRPVAMVLEKVYSEALFPHTAIVMGHVRGVLCLAAHRAGAQLIEIPPAEAKKALTGFGQAPKAQVAAAVARFLDLAEPPDSDHVADALTLAVVGAFRYEHERIKRQL